MASITVSIPRSLAERARKEAEKLGLGLEEYIIELLAEGLDPKDRAQEYVEAALELLGQAREELERGDIRQAAEKLWGATALAIKAYAWLRDGRRLASHGELWEYSKRLIDELGEWVFDAWMAANGMHTCFYEGWCTRGHVERALKRIERLVREVATRVKAGR
ncbi:PaREP1 family protein [Pyrolobus fumarii]|uniref:PaREP1 family protein n=1 Tax=Pyrolobus fumarii TaxID=54252 RepID=UPI00064FB06D|nr:PaREP1 family protein [Pyrolobus fumarii]